MEKDLNHNPHASPEEQTNVNIKELLFKYLHFSWLFILTIILSLIVAWVYLRYTKPLYNVSSTLLIRSDNTNRNNGSISAQDMFSDIALFQSTTNKQNEILILSSRTMMERVAKALGLQKKYEVVGNVKTVGIYPDSPFEIEIISKEDSTTGFGLDLHFSHDWKTFRIGEDKKEWVTGQEVELRQVRFKIFPRESAYTYLEYRDFRFRWMTPLEAANAYAGGLSVKPANDLSNVLSLNYTNENPILGAAILNQLMVQYNNAAIEDKNEMNRKILSFITDRLALVESQLDSVEGNLQLYRTQRGVIDLPAQSQMYFSNMTQLNENLRMQEIQLQIAELLEQYINQPANKLSLVPSTLGLTDPTLLELTADYNKLIGERITQLQTGATQNNPIVKNLEKNIEEARVKILQNLINIKQVYRNNINTIKSQSGSIKKEINSIPERERQSREKARQQEIKQNLYLYLMQKREESQIAQASTIANSRILDTALPVYKQVSPISSKVYGIAFLIGLVLPVIIIYLRDLMNDKVITRHDITKVTKAPVLCEVGHSEEEKVLLFPDKARSIVAEQMRILRSNLRFILRDKFEHPTILITSSFSGEGKSFISTNLGATLAVSGKKTVILEFDLRKPKILTGLGIPKGHGITNYLIGSAQLTDLAKPVPKVENLYVIPCGPVPPNPSEILLNSKIDELFAWLKMNFDAIVIDTAPVGLVSDSFTLSQYADSTIYVVRQRYTFKKQVNFIDELYSQNRLPNMGLLINDVVTEGARGYYGYGGGKYGYGYGYGYGYAHSTGESYFQDGKPGKKKGLVNRIREIFS